MAKYISKKETDKALMVNCKVWGCSRALSNVNVTLGEDTTVDFNDAMTEFTTNTSKGMKTLPHSTIHFTSLKNWKKLPIQLQEALATERDKIEKKITASAPAKSPIPEGGSAGAVQPLIRWKQCLLFPS